MTIAEQLIRAKTDLDEVYNAGYEAGKAEGGGEPTKVTDLTGTVWKLSNNIGTGLLNYSRYYIDFISNGTTYDSIKLSVSTSSFPPTVTLQYLVDNTATTVCTKKKSATWTHYNYRIIEISGGKDVTNTALIEQLYKDGELLSAETAEDLEAIGDLCEWIVTITSEDFYSISIRNYHPTYYLYCDINYGMETQSNFVVSPNSTRSWESGGVAESDIYLYITNVRWKRSAT